MFKKVLIANRGEIAVRILATCKRLGIHTVSVYSDADEQAPHVIGADERVRLGPPPVRESYLNVGALISAVRQTGADAVHPGYGLLSESRSFAEAVRAAGACFIGPPPEALEAFGDKIKARAVARSVGVEPPPGSEGPLDPAANAALVTEAERIGYPLLVKAAGGGGGIGMQIVRSPEELQRAAQSCSDRGRAAFGDERIYIERLLEQPRHIEVQILRDRAGRGVALGERECSVQRRHQKIIEETPSPAAFLDPKSRAKLYEDALRIVDKVSYLGAGTVEFVADQRGTLYFLEVNARLQVEHPVTELVTGLDLVEQQLLIAAGEELLEQVTSSTPHGHAIEARVYAEDPDKQFLPQPGRLERLRLPAGIEGVRVDSGVTEGGEVTAHYDPLIAKIIAHADHRQMAIGRLDRALSETSIELVGPKGKRATNLKFLRLLLADPRFSAGDYDTGLAASVGQTGRRPAVANKNVGR